MSKMAVLKNIICFWGHNFYDFGLDNSVVLRKYQYFFQGYTTELHILEKQWGFQRHCPSWTVSYTVFYEKFCTLCDVVKTAWY